MEPVETDFSLFGPLYGLSAPSAASTSVSVCAASVEYIECV